MSLAALLPLGTLPEDIPERLQVYQSQRYERSHRIQQATRDSGADLSKGQQLDMQSFTAYNVGHDEWHSSTAALRKHLAANYPSTRWRSPLGFGPAPGPRQPLGCGLDSSEVQRLRQQTPETSSAYTIRFRSSRTYLQQLLPPGFAFVSPATVCEATLSCRTLDGMTWLGGGGYSLIMLELHAVAFTKHDGERVIGSFVPLLLENLADPIITGREELGMPKVFSDIAVEATSDGAEVTMSWRGTVFGRMSVQGLREVVASNGEAPPQPRQGPPAPVEVGQLSYRYVPAVGQHGKADAEYAVLVPKPDPASTSNVQVRTASESSFDFIAGDWKSLPTLHNVTRVLAEMPKYGMIEAKHITATGVDSLSSAHRIE